MRFDLSPEGDLLVYNTNDQLTLRTQGNPIAANTPFASLGEALDYFHNVLNWSGVEAEPDPEPQTSEEGN